MTNELENLLEDLDSGEVVKIKYGECYAYSLDVVEELKQALTELKSIKEVKPSEAMENFKNMIRQALLVDDDFEEYANKVEQYILKSQKQEQKLNRVEKLTQLLFKDRRKIGQEYIKWCVKNNTMVYDTTNMATWVLCIKLKEVLNNE